MTGTSILTRHAGGSGVGVGIGRRRPDSFSPAPHDVPMLGYILGPLSVFWDVVGAIGFSYFVGYALYLSIFVAVSYTDGISPRRDTKGSHLHPPYTSIFRK